MSPFWSARRVNTPRSVSRHRAEIDPLEFVADEAGLRAAILNLAMNALEAAGTGRARSAWGHSLKIDNVVIDVSDTGPGPPPEVAETCSSRSSPANPKASGSAWHWPSGWQSSTADSSPGHASGGRTHFRLTLPKPNGAARGSAMSRILIVDDEASICWALREFLGDEGHDVSVAASAEEGFAIAGRGGIDAVVLDVRLPGMDGLTALRGFRERVGPAPIIVVTAFGNLETVVRAMEGGAFDYLVKPFGLDQAGAVSSEPSRKANRRRSDSPAASWTAGVRDPDRHLVRHAGSLQDDRPGRPDRRAGPDHGRERNRQGAGRAGHPSAQRAKRTGPSCPICLAALSPGLVERELFGHVRGSFTGASQDRKGLLELAHGGTVLLDEVGDIPPAMQVKLLRAIEHREVTPVGDARPRPTDIRLIAATNRPLDELMATGQFREDLFFRLSVFPIHIPPLRERRDDIPGLAEHFLEAASLAQRRRHSICRRRCSTSCTRVPGWATSAS